jgi:hypothetical protein
MRSLLLIAFTALALIPISRVAAADPSPASDSAALKRSADWALAHPSSTEIRFWTIAPLYDGLLRTATVTGYANYFCAVLRLGT